MANKKYKPQLTTFLGVEVRTVVTEDNKHYIVLKDMFEALGRVKEDGTWTNSKNKTIEFLEDIDKKVDHQLLVVDFGKKKGRGNRSNGSIQEVDCLLLETAPILLTQFRPINSNRRTEDENKKALYVWREFMKFVNELLVDAKAWEYIFTDKELNKEAASRITESGGTVMRMHQLVNRNMAILCGVYPDIKSLNVDECRTVEPVNKIDVMEAREYVIDKFCDIYELTRSHKEAMDGSLKLAAKKYNIECKIECN